MIGRHTGRYNTGIRNTFIGGYCGYNNTGSNNVFLGYFAGSSEAGSNKLYIENTGVNSLSALIYGEFDNNNLRFNANVGIDATPNSLYKLYIADTYSSVTTYYGLRSEMSNSGTGSAYGIYGKASGGTSGARYGVYGTATGGAIAYAGYFLGKVTKK